MSPKASGPSRSLWARLARHLLIVAVVLVVLVLGLRAWLALSAGRQLSRALAQVEANWGAADEVPAAPPEVAEAENAAVSLRAAVVVHGHPASSLAAISRFRAGGDGAQKERSALQAMVVKNAEALSLLDGALHLQAVDWHIEPPPGSHLPFGTPPVTLLISLGTTNWVSGMLAIADDQPGGALAAFRRQLLLARSLKDQADLMSQAVRLRLLSAALDLVKEILARTEPGADTLRQIQDELQPLRGGEVLQQAMIADCREMTRHHKDLLAGRDPAGVETARATAGGFKGWLYRPSLTSSLAGDLQGYDALLAWAGTPRSARGHEGQATLPFLSPDSRWVSKIIPDPRLAGQLLDKADLGDARLALARTAVTLRLEKLASGRYPSALGDDAPLDPLTGEPPLYEVDGEGFLLESGHKEFEDQATRNEPWDPAGLLSWQIPH